MLMPVMAYLPAGAGWLAGRRRSDDRMPIHRTAILRLHHPTQHVQALLEDTFAAYTRAFSAALFHYRTLDPLTIRALSSVVPTRCGTLGAETEVPPRTSARKLAQV